VILLKIAIQAGVSDCAVIKELLSPWSVSFTGLHDAEVVIVYRQKPTELKNTIVIPSDENNFSTWSRKMRLQVDQKNSKPFSVAATPQITLFFTPEKRYCFNGSPNAVKNVASDVLSYQDDTVVLKVDIVQEFKVTIDKTLTPRQSIIHRIVTGLPIPYGLAPTRLRDFLMKNNGGHESLSLCDKLPIDALRYSLVNAIELASGKELEKRPLFNNHYVSMLTHDVESSHGLKRALFLKKVEEKYDVQSAWYVPSNRYKLDDNSIRQLSNHGEVGAHDTKHDGKLAHLSKEKILKRVSEARDSLSQILKQPIDGFRAPILQHNQKILQALNEAGYKYDTSIPAWEPKHPYTMKPHGIGTIYPLTLGNLTEIPLTLPQDHQLLHVMGLDPKDVLKTWVTMTSEIRELGGVCMFLVHPDYEVAANIDLYEELVRTIASDSKSTITVPSRICAQMMM